MEFRLGTWATTCFLALAAGIAGCGDDSATDDGGRDTEDDGGTTDVPDESAEEDAEADGDDAEPDGDAPLDETTAEDGTDEGDVPETCGNGVRDPGEDCEGDDLGGADCASAAGLDEGTLACTDGCAFDASACHTCGNSVAEGPELCDGTDFRGDSCDARGYEAGELICAWCTIVNDSPCRTCGDGLAEAPAEECDGADLDHHDCGSFGWGGGDLACSGTCTFVDAACAPTVPVLRRPMNAAYVGSIHVPGSMRPDFSWEPSTGPTGAAVTYELEYADDSSFPAGSTTGATLTTPSHRPAGDLAVSTTPPVGRRYWWRVRACVGTICSAWTAPWYFTVGASDRDLNGDGYADLAIGVMSYDTSAHSHSSVRIYFGGPTGPGSAPDITLAGSIDNDEFGDKLAIAGDLNADGCADLAVTSTYYGGYVHVFLGAPVTGPDAVEDGLLDGSTLGANYFGTWLGPAGDVNGDGYADLVVSAAIRAGIDESGALWVYFGGPGATFDITPDGTAIGDGARDYYGPAAGVGDVNGDGYADVAAGAVRFTTPAGVIGGKAHLYHGGPGTTFDGTADESVLGFGGTWSFFGSAVGTAGDINDDGFADFLVGSWDDWTGGFDTGAVFLYRGGTGAVLDDSPEATFHGAVDDNLGSRVAAGDVDGDGRPDLLLAGNQDGRTGPDQFSGAVLAFLGGGWPFDTTSDAAYRGTTGARLGDSLAWAGDVDGDGIGDVVAGAWGDATGGEWAGAAFLFLGSSVGTFDLLPDWTVRGVARDELGISVD